MGGGWVFEEGVLVARPDGGVRRVWEVVEDRGETLLAQARRVLAVYPGGEERLVVGQARGEVVELSRARAYRRWEGGGA